MLPVYVDVTPWVETLDETIINRKRIGIFAVYGLAVDYANVDYQQLSGSPKLNYGCSNDNYVTVCGRCHHGSDFGNFLLGVAIQAAGESLSTAGDAGLGYFLLELLEDFRNQSGNASLGDAEGVPAGWNYAASGEYSPVFNYEQFCRFFNQQHVWYDTKRGISGCDHGYGAIPCRLDGPSLNAVRNSAPNYNEHISTHLNGYNRYGGETPLEETKRRLGSVLSEFLGL